MPPLQTHHDIQQGRPLAIDHVTGQTRAVRQLKTALEAHTNDRSEGRSGGAFPHVLLVGPSGVGKSTLAQIIANELASTLHEELAQNIYAPAVLHGLLMMVEAGHVVFLDEVHELNPINQTTLYRALEDRKLFLPSGDGTRSQAIDLPPFTLVAATTDEWLLNKPFRDRFKLVLRLVGLSRARFYNLVERGVFLPPVYSLVTQRPFFLREMQQRNLDVRRDQVGVNGEYVLFHEPRKTNTPRRRAATPTSPTIRTQPVTASSGPEVILQLLNRHIQGVGIQAMRVYRLVDVPPRRPSIRMRQELTRQLRISRPDTNAFDKCRSRVAELEAHCMTMQGAFRQATE